MSNPAKLQLVAPEPLTNPDAPATLHLSFETAAGSRTVIANRMSVRDALLVARAVSAAGHYAAIIEERAQYSFTCHLANVKAAKEQKGLTLVPAADNIKPFRKAKGRT